ncbi:MAG: site-specific integrase [Akkermansia sp.]|nr:site-specific integrase [Akkermansia sp.]
MGIIPIQSALKRVWSKFDFRETKPADVSFSTAVSAAVPQKANRRPRTRAEFRNVCERLIRHCPQLAEQSLSKISPGDCQRAISTVFPTTRQQEKARRILHNLFEISLRNGFCSTNPVAALTRQHIEESEICPLPWEQLCTLLNTARQPEHRPCMPPLGLMLWAGIRPAEIQRLDWQDIDWEEHIITLRARHSKTGGCRHVTLYPVLRRWLRDYGKREDGSICPPDWLRRWKRLRMAAGTTPWQQDVLRHTFASYHVKRWHNFPLLQAEMGHHSADLLRTRYLSMRGLTNEQARQFWKAGAL